MPPYVISQQQVQALAKAIYQVVSEEPC